MLARMRMLAVSITALLFASSVASAATWIEIGDAGELPARSQSTTGFGPLTSIVGHSSGDYADVDMFTIQINDPASFSARVTVRDSGTYAFDSRLFIFDSAGLGVVGTTTSNAPFIGSGPFAPQTTGVYYIAIAPGSIEPFGPKNEFGFDSSIFPQLTGERGPLGPTGQAGGLPVSSWGGSYGGIVAEYEISLSGATFAHASQVPEAAQWQLLYAGLLAVGFAVCRRRSNL